jgi:hypothetical protein
MPAIYNNKYYIPKGVIWSFDKNIQWNWYLIEFSPMAISHTEGDENYVTGTGGALDGDDWIEGNKGWMREDVLCTKNYKTPSKEY